MAVRIYVSRRRNDRSTLRYDVTSVTRAVTDGLQLFDS